MLRRARSAVLLSMSTALACHAADLQGVAMNGSQPADGARVTLFTSDLAFFAEQRTSPTGTYSFPNVPPGTYELGIAAPGMAYEQRSIVVGSGVGIENFALDAETNIGQWDVIGDTLPEFFDATDIVVLLPDERLFFCHDTTDPILFDPITGNKTFPASSESRQGCMNVTLTADGSVIMVGGQSPADPGSFRNAIEWVKTYDAVTDQWQQLPDMVAPSGRWYPGLARLADGSLLVMGGGTRPNAARTASCERFDPTTQTWSFTGSMLQPTEFPPSALLHTGEVLMTWAPPQLYNPVTGQWRATGDFVEPSRGFPGHSDHSILVLDDGRVAAVGLRTAGSGTLPMVEFYDPATETWTRGSEPIVHRFQSEVTALPDGTILVAGGETNGPPLTGEPNVLNIVRRTDIYNPVSDTWREVAPMAEFREYHAVTALLPDGRVVTTGGTYIKFQFGPTSANIEAYSPPYLFRGVRPQISSISGSVVERGDLLSLEIFPAMQITSVVLMGTTSHTHWVEAGVPRRIELPVDQSGTTVTALLPQDPNRLPLGHYLVFAMVDDIPSVAKTVRVDASTCICDLDGSEGTDVADLLAYLVAWFAGAPAAELSGDVPAVITVADLLVFLQCWFDGCP